MSNNSYELRRPGGDIDPKRVFNAPGVVLLLVVVTALIFVFLGFSQARVARFIAFAGAVNPMGFLAGAEANGGYLRWLSPLIGHMFLHAGIAHLGFNMLWLLALGTPTARRMGAENALKSFSAFAAASLFVTFYLLSGVAGALAFIAAHPNESIPMVGASGGVSGLLGGVVRFAFNRSTLFGPERSAISPLFSSSVVTWTVMVVVMNLLVGTFGGGLAGKGGGIAWEAHLGGYFFGLIAYPYFERLGRAFK